MIKFFIISSIILTTSCINLPHKQSENSAIKKTWDLPEELNEVSGLTATEKEHIVAMVQDEDGIIFFFDLQNGSISESFAFAKPGDFEGIEKVGDDYWVLRSDGTLFQIRNIGLENQETIKHKTKLSEQNDCEGFAFDKKRNQLLIACKGNPALDGKSRKKKKAVYGFDLKEQKLIKEPVFYIKEKELKELNDDMFVPFEPSAIAVDNISGNIYMLSSVGKSMLKLDINGGILTLERLSEIYFNQPEGILVKGDLLLISNEAKHNEPAKLMLYEK